MSTNKVAATQSRALKTISTLLLVIVAFSGIAVVIGATSFRLGLDLQGGTSVTLQPRVEAGATGVLPLNRLIRQWQLFDNGLTLSV